jgi:hypothetical protein
VNPFEAHQLIISLKTHFNVASYNWFKCKGRTKGCTLEKFDNSKTKFRVEQLAKKYEVYEVRDYCLANLVHDTKWTVFDPQSDYRYQKFKGNKAARKYKFQNEVKILYNYSQSHSIPHADIFKDIDGNCVALNSFLGGDLSIDSFVILDMVNPFIYGLCTDNIKRNLCQTAAKYQPFVKVKLDEFVEIEEKLRY